MSSLGFVKGLFLAGLGCALIPLIVHMIERDQIQRVTESTDEQIVDALKELSKKGKFRGVIDENSRVVYTQEAVSQLPKAVTICPNCDGKLEAPILPGEEESCPYCGHIITNRLK